MAARLVILPNTTTAKKSSSQASGMPAARPCQEPSKHFFRQPELKLVHTFRNQQQQVFFHDAIDSRYTYDNDVVICLDEHFAYPDYDGYYGPPSLGMILSMLNHPSIHTGMVIFQTRQESQRLNCLALIAFFLMLRVDGMTPEKAHLTVVDSLGLHGTPLLFGNVEPESNPDVQGVELLDILTGFASMLQHYPSILTSMTPHEYHAMERPMAGDSNWIIPGRLLAMAGPRAPLFGLAKFRKLASRLNIQHVIRLNRRHYDAKRLGKYGIEHDDLFFRDGTHPPPRVQRQFLALMRKHFADPNSGCLAVHCRAGLGRTGTLIAMWLMEEYGLGADEAIGFLRVMRPGMVLSDQPDFLRALPTPQNPSNHMKKTRSAKIVLAQKQERPAVYEATLRQIRRRL